MPFKTPTQVLACCALVCLLLLPVSSEAKAPAADFTDGQARAEQLTGWIAATPSAGFVPTLADRAYWAALAKTPIADEAIKSAKAFAARPTPALPPELYDDYKKTGQRKPYERPYGERMERLKAFVLAEGLSEQAGAYLSLIEAELEAILSEPTWAMPAHSAQFASAADARRHVDLGAAMRAWNLASVDRLLDDRLSSAMRTRIRGEVRERVLAPYLERARAGDARGWWWMSTTNNWNAVCHSGVLGAALLLEEEAGARAEFAAIFEAGTRRFIAGFADDGFCHEGLGYWNYGFGHYVVGAEALRRATGGMLDLLETGKVRRIAEFGARWQIAGNIYPGFSDVTLSAKPAGWLADFIALRFDLGRVEGEPRLTGNSLYQILFDLSLPRAGGGTVALARSGGLPLRDWFPDGGALVVRPQPAERGLAAAFKGGHNAQPHNHNDLGSFVVLSNGRRILTDLGGDTYVRDTFGPKRYTSGVLNSFGHPVPRVAGKLQRTGKEAKAVTVRVDFSEAEDLWEMDITSAYDVPALERLTRTFVFRRGGAAAGSLEIIDRVRFRAGEKPQDFDTALVLRGKQARELIDPSAQRFVVREGKGGLMVAYSSDEGAVTVKEEPIFGIVPDRPPVGTRVGLALAKPVTGEAVIRTVISPVETKNAK